MMAVYLEKDESLKEGIYKTTLKIFGPDAHYKIDLGREGVKSYGPQMEIFFAADEEKRITVSIS